MKAETCRGGRPFLVKPEGRLRRSNRERVTLVVFYPVDANGGVRDSAIIRTISANRFFEFTISAICNATVRARSTTFAPIPIVAARSPTRSEHE